MTHAFLVDSLDDSLIISPKRLFSIRPIDPNKALVRSWDVEYEMVREWEIWKGVGRVKGDKPERDEGSPCKKVRKVERGPSSWVMMMPIFFLHIHIFSATNPSIGTHHFLLCEDGALSPDTCPLFFLFLFLILSFLKESPFHHLYGVIKLILIKILIFFLLNMLL